MSGPSSPFERQGSAMACSPRPQIHAPLQALFSALASSMEDGSPNTRLNIGALHGSVHGDDRPRSAFAPLPSHSSAQNFFGLPNSGTLELPAHLRNALAQMTHPSLACSQDAGSSCQLAAMGSRAVDIPPTKVEQDEYLEGDEDNDTSSNQAVTTGSPTACGTPLSAEAKRKRRQEINRESARRVRKRKSEAHKKLQEEVGSLKSSLAAITNDQAVVVRYASELYKEREMMLRRATELETKWVTAECQLVVLRQQLTEAQ